MSSGRKQYPFTLIEPKWQQFWEEQQSFRAFNPNEEIPAAHPFGKRHGLSGKVADRKGLPPKFYVLDMFPYPSGAGLHVGHPEGYTATDILARYKRAAGLHVLHPMGWDAFGLPAEQYAIKTGQHPRKTTEANIATFKRQIKSLGFSYDWSREVDTTDPNYFQWTQWIFLKLYNSWFNPETNKAEPIETLKYPADLEQRAAGFQPAGEVGARSTPQMNLNAPVSTQLCQLQTGSTLEVARRAYRDSKRLAYVSEAPVWWCEQLGTVLANEEVIDGKSEVGGFPVVRKPMRQWMLRITAYAEKLLNDLDTIDWSDSLKEMQRNWIGKSEGAEVHFTVATAPGGTGYQPVPSGDSPDEMGKGSGSSSISAMPGRTFIPICESPNGTGGSPVRPETKAPVITVFTTRPDTLFGATYMVLAPEHRLVDQITTPEQRDSVIKYKTEVAKKSDLERTELAKEKTGVFTGAYAINPANGEKIPIWIADYVLASYGTGAIMAVPAHDERDWEFAKKFHLPIKPVVMPSSDWLDDHCPDNWQHLKGSFEPEYRKICTVFKTAFIGEAVSMNSANLELSLDDLPTAEAKKKITAWLESKGLGKRTINYKLRDWLFSRQRYWGEPFPIVWKKDANGNAYHEALPESALPVLPPALDDYKPTPDGQPPLARAQSWVNEISGAQRETNTMPQWAGSCWYYLRYLDARNDSAFTGKEAERYWMVVDGPKSKVQSLKSAVLGPGTLDIGPASTTPGVDLYVGGTEHAVLHLLYARFWHKVLFDLGYVSTPEPFFKLVNQGLILGEDGQKMSKSRGNVVNPDEILAEYGADAFRLYEMFLGPLQDTKPWSTKNVEGVYRFLGRVWRLFVDEKSEVEFEQALTTAETQRRGELLDLIKLSPAVQDVEPTREQLKVLHTAIKKVTEDLDGLRFNTAISAMMVFVNEATAWTTRPVSVMREFLILLQPFAPHIAEELWEKLSKAQSPKSMVTATSTASTLDLRPWTLDLAYQPWPKFDPALLVEDTLEIPVQVNGKLRDVIRVAAAATQQDIEAAALKAEKAQQFINGKMVKKVIVVPKKLVNIVVG